MAQDIDYYEVFGVDKPAEDTGAGAKEEKAADSPAETADTGAKEDEAADRPVDNEDDVTDTPDEGDDDGDKNAQFAKIRRDAEAKAAKKAAAERDRAVADLGLEDEYGNPIETYDAMREYNRRKAEKDRIRDEEDDMERYLDMGMSEDEAREIVELKRSQSRVKELEDKLKAQEEQAKAAKFRAEVEEELAIIRQFDPAITSVESLKEMDFFDEFQRYVAEGNNFITAYLKSHRGRAPFAAQTGGGKDHLKSTKTRGSGAIDVPRDVIEQYRIFNPTATTQEIRDHYRKHHKT